MADDGVARSLFLAGLMIVSVLVGVLFFDIQQEGENLAPVIEGDIPPNILIGSIDSVSLKIYDEEMAGLTLVVSLDGIGITDEPDSDGNLVIDISQLGVGSHSIKVVATDSLGQESKWTASFMIEYPDEGYTVIVVSTNEVFVQQGNSTSVSGVLVHQSMNTCELEWSDGNISEFSLNLPFDDEGRFELGFSNVQENLTISILGTCGTWVDSSELEVFNITVMEPEPEPEPKPEPKPVEVEETVEVQKPAEVQKAVEEKEAAVVIAQQQEEVAKEETQIAVEQDAEKSVEAPPINTIIAAPPEESDEAIYDLEMVYFAYDKSIITTAFGEALQKNYEWIAENPDVQIQLEGHCDERGTNEYNLALGERRAKAVFDYLISLGASPSQFSLVSFGEERPAEQGSNEVAWGKNRRVEFIRL